MSLFEKMISKHSQRIYSIVRLVFGFLFMSHGAQKLFGIFGGHGTMGMKIFLFAGIIEFFGGILIAIGYRARYIAIITACEMIYAYSTVHFPRGMWPIENGGELAVLYLLFFLFTIANGAGPWSVDAIILKKK